MVNQARQVILAHQAKQGMLAVPDLQDREDNLELVDYVAQLEQQVYQDLLEALDLLVQ